ncbi:Acetylornithine deacetylase/Succinyl-diaminopimelate desuccinylase and related deacylases [Olavius sp. associated proteobacterium Delta 1]|nr:Acetylornithine deacetylase/Succinyl-diaminopimelate desuccinylase and related deacylases [Olavius sp. associated proteobacterium Delta 1]
MTGWNEYLKENTSRYLEELVEFLRIPSISSLPEHAADVNRAAGWVAGRLKTAGIEEVQILPTEGHPVVFGQWLHAAGKPTIMIYGHFDTQPVDPLELWTHPPFEPVVKDDRIYARGASDDKGNMLIPILAAEAMLKTLGSLPVNVKFFFEGQEEIGSPQMPDFISSQQDLLACDMVLSADGGQWDENQPALNVGRRGLAALQIDVQSAGQDVHSGTYGGTFQNPIQALAQLLTSMRSPQGKILVEGFYDTVCDLSDSERAQIAEIPYDESQYREELDLDRLFGEAGYSTYERAWVRPTLEVNGIWGGFQGAGIKTVIPSIAHAKITCRLVPDQEPDQIVELIASHVAKHAPVGAKASVKKLAGSADPFLIPVDHPGNQAARVVLKRLYDKEPYIARTGGTIPVCGSFLKYLGAHLVNFAFGLEDENLHAPDEFFRISNFKRGLSAYGMILEELGR